MVRRLVKKLKLTLVNLEDRNQPSGEAGFTLVEVLISLILMGFVLTLLYGGGTYANRVFARTTELSTWTDDVVQVQDFMRDLISQAYPAPEEFQGGRGRIEFLAPVTREGLKRGLYKIILQRESDGKADRLVLTLAPVEEGQSESMKQEKIILVEDVKEMEFAYFSAGQERKAGTWLSLWEKGQELPQLLRMRLKTEKGLHNEWPTLIIPFQITQNVDCRYDSVSRNCV